MSSLQAVLFDLDGTLLDSVRDIHEAFAGAAREFGLRTPAIEEVRSYIGLPLAAMFRGIYGEMTDARAEALSAAYRAGFAARPMNLTSPYPGAKSVLTALSPIPLGVATTKRSRQAEHALAQVGLRRWFRHVQGTDDFPAKPAPDVLLRCCEKLGCAPLAAAYVGDGPWDMLAARAAGMPGIGVDHDGTRGPALRAAGAVFVVRRLKEIERLFRRSGQDIVLVLPHDACQEPASRDGNHRSGSDHGAARRGTP